jgi:hypothetical protein
MTQVDRSSRGWQERYRSRVRGCLVGGAVGDALGAPVELLPWERIRELYGPDGVTGTVVGPGGQAQVTDDTQMTLFTAEGLIRASVRSDRGVCHPPSVLHRERRWALRHLDRPTLQAAEAVVALDGHTEQCAARAAASVLHRLSPGQPLAGQSTGCRARAADRRSASASAPTSRGLAQPTRG